MPKGTSEGVRKRGPRPRFVTPGHHPLVHFMDDQLAIQRVTAGEAADRAGLGHCVVSQWRRGVTPSISNFDAVLNVLGYKLAVVPL